jgi:hypothetical protein
MRSNPDYAELADQLARLDRRLARIEKTIISSSVGVFSVSEFCRLYLAGGGESTFYDLKKRGEGPRSFKSGFRTLISREAAQEWVREREAKAQQPKAPTHNCDKSGNIPLRPSPNRLRPP